MKQLITSILAAAASVAWCDGIHIGTGATASPDSAIAIGDGAHATGSGVVAIGNGTAATNGVAIGGFQLMDGSGLIPAARLANAPVPSETDPTVSAWAKAASKPSYAWSEIGSKPAFAAVATSGAYSDLSGTPTIPTALSQLTADTTHRLVTDSEKSTWNGKQNALTAGANITISGNTISATIPAPSITVSWNTAAKGANPTEALAVASCTYYKRTGSGTYTFSAITGLTAVPTYFVLEGFSALVLPASVQTVGSGIFRSGKKNHFTMWTTPSGTFINFLFALP